MSYKEAVHILEDPMRVRRAQALVHAVERSLRVDVALVLDADETIYNAVLVHYEITQRLIDRAIRLGKLPPDVHRPTFEEVCQAGGTQPAYSHFADHGLPYDDVNRAISANWRVIRGVPLLDDSAPEIINRLGQTEGIASALVLSTRPDNVAELTSQELLTIGVDLPVICRPPYIPKTETASWKYDQLALLASAIPGHVVLIDDSVSTAQYILDKKHARIHPLVFDGPITKQPIPVEFMSANWNTIISVVSQFREGVMK